MATFDSLDTQKELDRIPSFKCAIMHGFIREHDEMCNTHTPCEIIHICLLYAFRVHFESSILNEQECGELDRMIAEYRDIYPSEWKLLYKGSRDGYKVKQCHPKCYSQKNVILIVETKKGSVFGGFTQHGWDSQFTGSYVSIGMGQIHDKDAFLFRFRSKTQKQGIFPIKNCSNNFALYHKRENLFCFGVLGTDLSIEEEGHVFCGHVNGSSKMHRRSLR